MLKIPSILLSAALISTSANADLINVFPIDPAKQVVSNYIDPNAADYNTPLLSASQQQQRLQQLYSRYFSSTGSDQSPWNANFVSQFLAAGYFENNELAVLKMLNLPSKFDSNFRPYTAAQISAIKTEMNLDQTIPPYSDANRAIAITNLQSRIIPSRQPNYRKYTIPGEGYPFDYSLATTIYAGTPLYIVATSKSGQWLLVLTPRILTWVPAEGIAIAGNDFVTQWQNAAKAGLAAITQNATPLYANDGNKLFGYIGSVFPVYQQSKNAISLMIPQRDANGYAQIAHTGSDDVLTPQQVAVMPLTATPHNFANVIQAMQNKTYGWCGYNLGTDGALELQDLMTPFGFFLPRYTTDQLNLGKVIDLTTGYTPSQRQQYLMTNGHKLVTFVRYGGQISLYVGNSAAYTTNAPIVYQNMWGLRDAANTYRTVVGESVLFPLLLDYSVIAPSLSGLLSPLSYSFKISLLDQQSAMNDQAKVNLQHFVFPEWMLDKSGNAIDLANK